MYSDNTQDPVQIEEPRITATLLSKKPREASLQASLLVAMVIALVSMLCWRDPHYYRLLSASADQIFKGREYWRLLSTIAVHADLPHLAVNSAFLLFFGYLLYGYFGFGIYPVAMLVLASLITLLALLTYPPQLVLIGASGLVYLMAGFWLAIYAMVERTMPLRKRLLRIIGITLIVFLPATVRPEVSYRTHAIGAGVGILTALVYFLSMKRHIRAQEMYEHELPDVVH